MMDLVSALCWSAVYLLVLYNYVFHPEEHNCSIPVLAVSMNIAWECNAMIANGWMWGHVAWFFLDACIFVLSLFKVWRRFAQKKIYFGIYLAFSLLMYPVFYCVFRIADGMLISSFAINLWMSVLFVIGFKRINKRFKLVNAILKLIGTVAPTFSYGMDCTPVLVIGILILLVDLFYLALSLEGITESGKKR